VDSRAVSIELYETYFHELNLTIKAPKKDTCYTCDELKMSISLAEKESRVMFEKHLATHHNLADAAYLPKARDKEAAVKDESKVTLTFDMQQCLPTPMMETLNAFCKQVLITYNLTIHDCKSGQAYCNMWREETTSRGKIELHLVSLSIPLT
jgi:hypothetical protein